MDKQEVLKEYRKTEDRILLSQVLDKIEIAEKRNQIQYTDFLDMYQVALVKKFLNNENIVTNVNSLIGKKAIVIQDIDNLKSTGQVKIGGEIWSAQSESNDIISKDTEVEIVKIDGVKLIVRLVPVNVY